MQLFTENPAAALSRVADDGGGVGDSQVLDSNATALPGALEVHLIRATDLEWVSGACSRACPRLASLDYASIVL